jgi:hypothetical protein
LGAVLYIIAFHACVFSDITSRAQRVAAEQQLQRSGLETPKRDSSHLPIFGAVALAGQKGRGSLVDAATLEGEH